MNEQNAQAQKKIRSITSKSSAATKCDIHEFEY